MISGIVDIKGEVEFDKESGGVCGTQRGKDPSIGSGVVKVTKGLAEILKTEGLIGKDTLKEKD